MAKYIGGFELVDYSSDPNFETCKELLQLTEEGTGIEPETPTEKFSSGKEGGAGKKYSASATSVLLDSTIYEDLIAAEEALTPMYFRYHCVDGEQVIEPCETAWNEFVASGVTPSADAAVKAKGAFSSKFVIDATPGPNALLATKAIGPIDLTEREKITLWVQSSVNLAAGDLQLLLDNTAQCASPIESLNLPAITANTMTKVTLTLATPASLGAVISVGIKQVVDKGAFTLYLDDIRSLMANYVVKGVLVQHVDSPKEFGKHHAKKVMGVAAGNSLSDVIEFTP